MKKRMLPNGIIFLLALLVLLVLPGQTSQVPPACRPARDRSLPPSWPIPPIGPCTAMITSALTSIRSETIIGAGNVGQLVQRWQANVGNNGTPGSAAPSVSNGVVYVGSSAASPSDNFFAFDAASGNSIWHENIGYRSSCFNVGIGSTPAISGTQVVVGEDNASNNPAYNGIDTMSGTKVWTNTMSVGASGFPWELPFLYNNRAYVGIASRCDNPSVRGELRAVDMTSGNTVASAFFVGSGEAGGGIWNSPALSPDGSTVAVGTGEDFSCTDCSLTRSMVTMDSNTLAVLQHHQEPSPSSDLDFGTTAIIFHDSQNRTLVAAGHKNGIFYTYDITNVNSGAIWTHSAGGTNVGLMPAYDPTFGSGGTLFIVNGSIYAVDPANGNLRWGPVSIPTTHGNIAVANGLIFINGGSSGLQIRSETDGSLLRTITPASAGSANSGVAVSHGFIYWLSGSYVNAWSLPPSGTPSATDTALVGTHTPTPTITRTPTTGPSSTRTSTPLPSPTNTPPAPTDTPLPTQTPGGPSATSVPTNTSVPPNTFTATSTPEAPTVTPTACTLTFSDVPPGSTFFPFVRCLACLGIINGYPNGTFKPGNDVTRGQLSKIVSNSAGFSDNQTARTFQDVPVGSTFFQYIGRLASRGFINGYPCGGNGEPCVPPDNLPYFRPNNNATRGQISKIVSNAAGYNDVPIGLKFEDVPVGSAYYTYTYRLVSREVMSGYPCGIAPAGQCVPPDNRPYFLPNNNATRGQTSKIDANTFFPGCSPPVR